MNTYYSVEHILSGWHQSEIKQYSLNQIPEVLYRMKRRELSREQLTEIISVRYQAAHFFEDMLREIMRVVDAGTYRGNQCPITPEVMVELRKAAALNLSEELGEVKEYGGPHREGREVLLTSLGVDYAKWQSTLGSYENIGDIDENAKWLVSRMRWIIQHGAIEAIAALWYYENRISLDHVYGDYHLLLHAFEEKFPEFKKPGSTYHEGDPLWHIYSHADHDEHHANLAKQSLLVMQPPGLWPDSIVFGLRESSKAIDYFWCGLSERFFGRFNSKDHWEYED